MQLIKVNELIPHPRNNEFFDDMTGEKWEEFLESIRSRGVIEPVVITQDKTIVSGHQRVRACKELGIQEVMCDTHLYDHEDQILQDLIETNVRQRGVVGGSEKQKGRIIKELERIYGIQLGNNQFRMQNNFASSTQEKLADMFNITTQTLRNYKSLTEMIPELEELVDTGIVSETTALAIMRQLSEEDQVKMIESLPASKKITKREMQKYIDEVKRLSKENEFLRTSAPGRVENKTLKIENERLELENKMLKTRVKIADEDVERYKSESEEYTKVKEDIIHMGLDPNGDYNNINAAAQVSQLNREVRDFLQNRLAPLKYQEYIYAIKDNSIVKQNLLNTLEMVNDWYLSMLSYLDGDTYREIDIEENNYMEEI